jgi:hypothetical protein
MIPWSSGNDSWFTSGQRWFESIRDHVIGRGAGASSQQRGVADTCRHVLFDHVPPAR